MAGSAWALSGQWAAWGGVGGGVGVVAGSRDQVVSIVAPIARPLPSRPMSEGGLRNPRIDLVAAVLLGLAALGTALAAYLAGLKDGEALEGYTMANTLQSQAADRFGEADQLRAFDQLTFLQYEGLRLSGNEDAATRIRDELMSPELIKAVEWYEVQPPEVVSPFEEGSPYAIPEFAIGEKLADDGAALFATAKQADDTGDMYNLATVVLALALFFGGIATLLGSATIQKALLGISAVALVAGLVQLALIG